VGSSFVDQAAITGEPMPVEKSAGDKVFAGTINQSGALEVMAERLGRDTTFGHIVEAVERAERSRAPIQKTADRLSGYLVYFALGAAVLTFILTHNIRSTISVVIVAGACGIAAGTPLAILGAIGRAAQQGVVIKGGLYLEALASIDTVVLDKTGTLTFGTPQVVDVVPLNGAGERDVLAVASTAEAKSEHPLAKAIIAEANTSGILYAQSERFSYTLGRGIIAHSRGDEIIVGSRAFMVEQGLDKDVPANESGSHTASEIFVARNGKLLGLVRIADILRPEAKQAISALRRMGLKTVLLSGDRQEVTDSVGRDLGVDQSVGGLLPDEKLNWIKKVRSDHRNVAMIGDGVNDAPALVEANVGIAMGSGTDVARESADIILIGSDLSRFVEVVQVARHCRAVIMQNFVGTLLVDSVGIVLAAIGILNPLLAAFIHVSSEMAFILNSTRLLPKSLQKTRQSRLYGEAQAATGSI
jgi:Cd2+/Zn2+-exporting ATPase/Cu+-exporting ATPase